MCDLSDNVHDYNNVAQGKITIPNVDDGEECTLTDVRIIGNELNLKKNSFCPTPFFKKLNISNEKMSHFNEQFIENEIENWKENLCYY
jgi:hypothetical protein